MSRILLANKNRKYAVMKISELIELLQKHQQDKEVYFASPGMEFSISGVKTAGRGQAYLSGSGGEPHSRLPNRVVLVGDVVK
jgi:hypothetical protein